MTQQINLYQPELYERHVPFSAGKMAAMLAVVAILIMTAGGVSYWRTTGAVSELNRLQTRRDDAVQRVADYQRDYPARPANPDLVREVEEMMDERQAYQTLLQTLSGSQPGNRSGLSEHLAGLARQDLSTVWLRRIRLSDGGNQMLLEGGSTREADIPLYLQRLNEQPVFAGREFEHLQLNRAEAASPIVDFVLQTTEEEEP